MPAAAHPFDALEDRFALEDSSSSPVTVAILELASSAPLPWPMDKVVQKIKAHLGADSLDRIRIMLTTCMDEVRKHGAELETLRETMCAEEVASREAALRDLVLDASRKAEATRGLERVRRIGMILATSAIESKAIDADEVEEMMRVAMNLSDLDVLILKAAILIYDQETTTKSEARNSISARVWMAVAHQTSGISGDELASIGAKLQSFGLASRIEGITGDTDSFAVLQRGRRFTQYIGTHVGQHASDAL
ncbi:hypothetical protein [Paludibaculum fermentans]|uniref:hypothetical protein n=1 Tax=Paludibaculum fermentans TaxID=1473598 RepID=UPI003EBC6C50